MVNGKEIFGAFIRREREGKGIGLREMARTIGVSPTYLSLVERDEMLPPAEDKVKAIAKIIECDADDLLARAGRISTDISDIIKRHPIELAALLRTTKGLSVDDIVRLVQQARAVQEVNETVELQRVEVSKPRNPAEACKWLRGLANQFEEHLHEYAVHETFADARHLRWFVDAAKSYNSKKSLDQLLGLKNLQGRPKSQKPGKNFDLAYKIFLMRSTKSQTRKSEKGEWKPMSWKEVAKALDMSPSKAQKIYQQELPNVTVTFAKKLAARRRR
jgi:transcriptional regulator with XRE-family HTH domain